MVDSFQKLAPVGTTTQLDIPQILSASYTPMLLRVNKAKLVHTLFGTLVKLPKGKHSTTIVTRIEKLSEGEKSPENSDSYVGASKIVETPYSITGYSFEKLVQINYALLDLHENPQLLAETVKNMRTSLEETMDAQTREELLNAPAYFASQGTTGGNVTEPVRRDFLALETIFGSADVERITTMIAPTDKVSTEGITDSYICIASAELSTTLRLIEGFIDKKDYSQVGLALPGEIGAIGAFRILITSKGYKNIDNDTYSMFCFGKDAYHTISIGDDLFGIAKDTGALDKFTQVGYRIRFGARITNPNNIVQMICRRVA